MWKHFPRYWPFVRGIYRSPVNSPHKGQWRRALMFSLICTRINGWVNNGEAGDLRRHRAHYDVIVMWEGNLASKSINSNGRLHGDIPYCNGLQRPISCQNLCPPLPPFSTVIQTVCRPMSDLLSWKSGDKCGYRLTKSGLSNKLSTDVISHSRGTNPMRYFSAQRG